SLHNLKSSASRPIERSKRILTHDEQDVVEFRLNDTVLIQNCPPISARKHFKLEKILKRIQRQSRIWHTCRLHNSRRV
ncbi:hypothetical protein P692DRAFT_20886549, partial [Suillus brevipes Sb2]